MSTSNVFPLPPRKAPLPQAAGELTSHGGGERLDRSIPASFGGRLVKLAPRLSMEMLILLGLLACLGLARFSFPPLDTRPIRIERAESMPVGEDRRLGIVVRETGLRHER